MKDLLHRKQINGVKVYDEVIVISNVWIPDLTLMSKDNPRIWTSCRYIIYLASLRTFKEKILSKQPSA